MNLRHLRYFVTLAREGHHGRAAAACNVTQPTLSEAVRQLERELAVPLIDRNGPRFRGLTAEGMRALAWAQRILADQDALEQELAEMRHGLSGEMRFGVIPAATPVAPLVTLELTRAHPRVRLRLLSLSSIEIQRGLDAGELDAGLTYLENEPLRNVRTFDLYRERYMFLTPAGGPFEGRKTVSWREAAELPLCLLTPDMQNRRIIDRLFAEAGIRDPNVAMATDSVLALIAYVRAGEWSSVVPHTFLPLLQSASAGGMQAIPLVEPVAKQAVGLVVTGRDPLPPLAKALLDSVRHIDIPGALRATLPVTAA